MVPGAGTKPRKEDRTKEPKLGRGQDGRMVAPAIIISERGHEHQCTDAASLLRISGMALIPSHGQLRCVTGWVAALPIAPLEDN
jgi:hypothetical protein